MIRSTNWFNGTQERCQTDDERLKLTKEKLIFKLFRQYPIYTSRFSLLIEGSLGIIEALCCKINASVKLLSWIIPKECNDSVSKMLTTAEPWDHSVAPQLKKKIKKARIFREQMGSISSSYLSHCSPPLPFLKSSQQLWEEIFYPITFTHAQSQKTMNQWLTTSSFFYCSMEKDCWSFIHMLGS